MTKDQATAVPRTLPAANVSRLALALPLAVWLALLLFGLGELDRLIVVRTHVGEEPWLTPVLFVTRLGDWELLLSLPLLAAAWIVLKGRGWRLAALLLGSTILGRLLVDLQKVAFSRVRPDSFEHPVAVSTFSFPSGHATNSLIVYGLIALLVVRDPARRRVALAGAAILSLLIGISRVLLGVHWPSDVIGGWAFATVWLILTLEVGSRWKALNKR